MALTYCNFIGIFVGSIVVLKEVQTSTQWARNSRTQGSNIRVDLKKGNCIDEDDSTGTTRNHD